MAKRKKPVAKKRAPVRKPPLTNNDVLKANGALVILSRDITEPGPDGKMISRQRLRLPGKVARRLAELKRSVQAYTDTVVEATEEMRRAREPIEVTAPAGRKETAEETRDRVAENQKRAAAHNKEFDEFMALPAEFKPLPAITPAELGLDSNDVVFEAPFTVIAALLPILKGK